MMHTVSRPLYWSYAHGKVAISCNFVYAVMFDMHTLQRFYIDYVTY